MRGGALTHILAFDEPTETIQDTGVTEEGWTEFHRCRASFQFLRGGHSVQGARLTGTQPAIVKVRANDCTAKINCGTRIRDCVTGVSYNVKTIFLDEKRKHYELFVESGIAI